MRFFEFRKIRRGNRSAFSLIQLMVAVLISAVVIASALMAGLRFFSKTSDSEMRASVLRQASQSLDILREDFNRAVRVNGVTQNIRPGIAPFDPQLSTPSQIPEPRPTDERFQHLTIYQQNVPDYSLPVVVTYDSANELIQVQATLADPSDTSVNINIRQIHAFFSQAHSNHRLYALRGLNSVDIFESSDSNYDPSTRNLVIQLSARPRNSTMPVINAVGELGAGPFSINTVERVDYYMAGHSLIREIRRDDTFDENQDPDSSGSSLIGRARVADRVYQSTFDFEFGNNGDSIQDSNLFAPPGRFFTHIADESYLHELTHNAPVGASSVGWAHIMRVRPRLSIASSSPTRTESASESIFATVYLNEDGDEVGENTPGGRYYWLVDYSTQFSPTDFSDKGTQVAQGALGECHPDNPASRCNQACEDQNPFTDTNPTSRYWEGFGRYVNHPDGASDYCVCGTTIPPNGTPIFANPEFSSNMAAIPNFVSTNFNDPINVRLEACVSHFGVDNADLRAKDPRAQIIFRAAMRPAYFFSGSSNSPSLEDPFKYNQASFDELSGLVAAYVGIADQSEGFNSPRTTFVRENFDDLSNVDRQIFCRWPQWSDVALARLIGQPDNAVDIARRLCQCRIRTTGPDGEPGNRLSMYDNPQGGDFNVENRNYRDRCDPEICPMNAQMRDVNGNQTMVYRIREGNNEQFLTQQMAALCECVRTRFPNVWDGPNRETSLQWRDLDFRVPLEPGDFNGLDFLTTNFGASLRPTNSHAGEATFLSNASEIQQVFTMDESGNWDNGFFNESCGASQCFVAQMAPSVGCCSESPNGLNSNTVASIGALLVAPYATNQVDPPINDGHHRYCTNSCRDARGRSGERTEARHVITNTAHGASLPVGCGGSQIITGGNNNDGVVPGGGL